MDFSEMFGSVGEIEESSASYQRIDAIPQQIPHFSGVLNQELESLEIEDQNSQNGDNIIGRYVVIDGTDRAAIVLNGSDVEANDESNAELIVEQNEEPIDDFSDIFGRLWGNSTGGAPVFDEWRLNELIKELSDECMGKILDPNYDLESDLKNIELMYSSDEPHPSGHQSTRALPLNDVQMTSSAQIDANRAQVVGTVRMCAQDLTINVCYETSQRYRALPEQNQQFLGLLNRQLVSIPIRLQNNGSADIPTQQISPAIPINLMDLPAGPSGVSAPVDDNTGASNSGTNKPKRRKIGRESLEEKGLTPAEIKSRRKEQNRMAAQRSRKRKVESEGAGDRTITEAQHTLLTDALEKAIRNSCQSSNESLLRFALQVLDELPKGAKRRRTDR